MAYFFFSKNVPNSTDIFGICENANDKQYFQQNSCYEEIEVSNEDFLKIKRATHTMSARNGSSFTWVSTKINVDGNPHTDDIECVQDQKEWVSGELEKWLKDKPSHAKTSEIQAYKNAVDAFDPSTVTVPTSLKWGEIMESNSIPYFSIEELPRY